MPTIAEVYELCCTQRFPLPTEAEIAALERRLKIQFPLDYRGYLAQFNGGAFRDARIVFPEPITVTWRDGLVTHIEDDLDEMHGLHATFKSGELGKQSDLSLFENNDPIQLLPIGYTAVGCLLLLDLYPGNEGEILIKFPNEKAYQIADDIGAFFSLIERHQGE